MCLKLLAFFSSFSVSATLLAQGAAAPKAPTLTESLLLPMAVVFGIVYFMMIRPQAKKQKAHDELLKGLKPGDEVVTTGGIIGRVKSVADQFVSLELSPNTNMKIQKVHIAGLSKPPETGKAQSSVPAKSDK
jgi:preprotein translocase subunit YajC